MANHNPEVRPEVMALNAAWLGSDADYHSIGEGLERLPVEDRLAGIDTLCRAVCILAHSVRREHG